MTTEQWFHLPDVFLLIALSCLALVGLIFGGAFVIDLIDGFKRRGITAAELQIDLQDEVSSRGKMRPRVWARHTKMPLGSNGNPR